MASFDRTIEIQVTKGRSLPLYVTDWIEYVRAALESGDDWRAAEAVPLPEDTIPARSGPWLVQ